MKGSFSSVKIQCFFYWGENTQKQFTLQRTFHLSQKNVTHQSKISINQSQKQNKQLLFVLTPAGRQLWRVCWNNVCCEHNACQERRARRSLITTLCHKSWIHCAKVWMWSCAGFWPSDAIWCQKNISFRLRKVVCHFEISNCTAVKHTWVCDMFLFCLQVGSIMEFNINSTTSFNRVFYYVSTILYIWSSRQVVQPTNCFLGWPFFEKIFMLWVEQRSSASAKIKFEIQRRDEPKFCSRTLHFNCVNSALESALFSSRKMNSLR